MTRLLFPEFRDELEPTKYPFADDASLAAAGGVVVVGSDTFLDASLYPVGGGPRQYLSRVVAATREVTLYTADPTRADLSSVTFDPLDPPDDLYLEDAYGRPAGVLVSEANRLASFQAWPRGETRFLPGATEFCASCVVPVPDVGVRGVLLDDGTLLTGDVWLVGEDGVVLRTEGGEIRVDVVGDPLFRRRLCQPTNLFTTPRFVKTVNGVPPDARGEFQLTVGRRLAADTVLRIFPDGAGGLTISAAGPQL